MTHLGNQLLLAGLDQLNLDLLALGPLHGGRNKTGRLIRDPDEPLLGPLRLSGRITESIAIDHKEPEIWIVTIHRLAHDYAVGEGLSDQERPGDNRNTARFKTGVG